MITPTDMLDWSISWLPVASDGFKAEMIWLAGFYGLEAHPAVNGLTFAAPEWEYFAFKQMPSAYKNPMRRNQYHRAFEQMQEDAIYNIGGVKTYPMAVGDNNNLVVHKVVWSSQFGRNVPAMPDSSTYLQNYLNDPDDDVHAKSVLALQVMGVVSDQTRIDSMIAATGITPQTYHPLLCALVTKGI